jgi:hypothetical protein
MWNKERNNFLLQWLTVGFSKEKLGIKKKRQIYRKMKGYSLLGVFKKLDNRDLISGDGLRLK